jgi:ABC-type polysaccharide transport system permease subunit
MSTTTQPAERVAVPTAAKAARASGPTFWTTRRRDVLTGYLFILPQLAGVAVFVLLPVGMAIWYSLNDWNVFTGKQTFVGGENYAALASDPQLPKVLLATVIFSGGVVVVNITLGLLIAVLLNRKFRGVTLFRTLFFSPVVVSVVAWTLVWGFLLQDNGGINGLLGAVGIDGPNWLQHGNTAMVSVVITQVIRSVGVNMVLFLAALQGVPGEQPFGLHPDHVAADLADGAVDGDRHGGRRIAVVRADRRTDRWWAGAVHHRARVLRLPAGL